VQCAVAVQDAIAKENEDRPAGEQMRFRIGIHVGDIMVQGDNLLGDAVNITARLESLAEPGGICVSGAVRDHIGTKLPVGFIDLGKQQVKNIAQPVKALPDRKRDRADRHPRWRFFASSAGQAFYRSPAIPKYERRSRTGIFRRRDG